MFGLRAKDIEFITNQSKEIEEVEKVAIFGSRAKNMYKENSDIDIVVYGEQVNKKTLYFLYEKLEENAPYPFFVDIVNYEKANELLKKEIDDSSIVIYQRGE